MCHCPVSAQTKVGRPVGVTVLWPRWEDLVGVSLSCLSPNQGRKTCWCHCPVAKVGRPAGVTVLWQPKPRWEDLLVSLSCGQGWEDLLVSLYCGQGGRTCWCHCPVAKVGKPVGVTVLWQPKPRWGDLLVSLYCDSRNQGGETCWCHCTVTAETKAGRPVEVTVL